MSALPYADLRWADRKRHTEGLHMSADRVTDPGDSHDPNDPTDPEGGPLFETPCRTTGTLNSGPKLRPSKRGNGVPGLAASCPMRWPKALND